MSANTASNSNLNFNKWLEPDELTSAQFYETTRRSYLVNPELRLMAAVLEDAVATLTTDLRRCSKRQRRDFAEAMRWVVNSEDNHRVFSFANICESLAINPDYLRAGLIRKVNQIGENKSLLPKGKGRHLPARHKVVRLRAG